MTATTTAVGVVDRWILSTRSSARPSRPSSSGIGLSTRRSECAFEVLDPVHEVRAQLVGLARGGDVRQPSEQLAVDHLDLAPREVGAEAEVWPGRPEAEVRGGEIG